jgi:hypothetical protein
MPKHELTPHRRATPSGERDQGDTTMTTLLNEMIETGDVLELTRGGETISALVLLAADTAVILDACDGSTPFVVKRDELLEYRKFVPTA